MAETTMSSNLLQALQILTEFRIDTVGENLAVFTIHNIPLSVQKPGGNLILCGILYNRDNPFQFFARKFTSTANTLSAHLSIFHFDLRNSYRLLRSTSAFLQTKFEYRRPTPLILVKAYMTFCLPSTLVLSNRRMNWKFDFSPETKLMMGD